MNRKRCGALTKKGIPCSNSAIKGEDYCKFHVQTNIVTYGDKITTKKAYFDPGIPTGYWDTYTGFREDPDLMNMDGEIAFLRTLVKTAMDEINATFSRENRGKSVIRTENIISYFNVLSGITGRLAKLVEVQQKVREGVKLTITAPIQVLKRFLNEVVFPFVVSKEDRIKMAAKFEEFAKTIYDTGRELDKARALYEAAEMTDESSEEMILENKE